MIPYDTQKAAYEAQMAAYRRMSGEERVRVALKLSQDVRDLAAVGIRERNPGFTEEEIRHAIFRQIYGDEFYTQVYLGAKNGRPSRSR